MAWVLRVVFADRVLVDVVFLVEVLFLVELDFLVELECFELLETALSTSLTSQDPNSGWQPTAHSTSVPPQSPSALQQSPKPEPTQVIPVPQEPSVDTASGVLPATAEASSRAKVEMAARLPILLNERMNG